MVSFETAARHYEIHRWKLERDSAARFTTLWARVGASSLENRDKELITNVVWVLASLERSYQILEADALRAEQAANFGVPAVMLLLTGPYKNSLDYLFGSGLWMDLAEVITAYRTIGDRFRKLKGSARRGKIPLNLDQVISEDAAALASNRARHGFQFGLDG